jgi:hypothetical protein
MRKEMECESVTAAELKTPTTQAYARHLQRAHPLPAGQNRAGEFLNGLTASNSPEVDETEDDLLSALSFLAEAADFEELMGPSPKD